MFHTACLWIGISLDFFFKSFLILSHSQFFCFSPFSSLNLINSFSSYQVGIRQGKKMVEEKYFSADAFVKFMLNSSTESGGLGVHEAPGTIGMFYFQIGGLWEALGMPLTHACIYGSAYIKWIRQAQAQIHAFSFAFKSSIAGFWLPQNPIKIILCQSHSNLNCVIATTPSHAYRCVSIETSLWRTRSLKLLQPTAWGDYTASIHLSSSPAQHHALPPASRPPPSSWQHPLVINGKSALTTGCTFGSIF